MGAESTDTQSRGSLTASIRAGLGWLWHLLVDHGPEPRRALAVIAWWELRRPIFNGVVIAGGSLTILLWALTIKSWISILPPPMFFFFGVIFFFVLANACYTGGWVGELIVRKIAERSSSFAMKFAKRAFVTGTLFSFGLTAVPGLAALAFYVAGHPMTTPQSTFTTTPPVESLLVGRYDADSHSLYRMDYAGLDTTQAHYVVLNDDHTCRIVNFPSGFDYPYGNPVEVSTHEGIWALRGDSSAFETFWYVDVADEEKRWGYSFHLRNDAPPYELFHWISDPDIWDFLVFRQDGTTDSSTTRSFTAY